MANAKTGHSSLQKDIAFPVDGLDVDEALGKIQEFYQSGRLKQAQRICKEVLQVEPDSQIALRQLGIIAHRMDEFENAKQCFFDLTCIAPNDASVYYNLGNTCVRLNDLDLAFAAFAKTVELDPQYASAYNNMGVILQMRGDMEDAIDYFYDANELNPEHTLSRMYLAESLGRLHRLDECNEVIDNSLSINTLSPEQRAELMQRQAINAWLESDYETCEKTLNMCSHILPHLRESEAFRDFIESFTSLFMFKVNHSDCYEGNANASIYYLSDKSALPAANIVVEMNDLDYRVNALYVEDSDISALLDNDSRLVQAGFKAAIDQIPNKSPVFVDFNEQSCHFQGALFKAFCSKRSKGNNYLKKVCEAYVKHLDVIARARHLKLVFVGAPAANIKLKGISPDRQKKYIAFLEQFNVLLAAAVVDHSYAFLDVYTPTISKSGFSNKRYHLNDSFLKPSIFNDIIGDYLLTKKLN